jgi:hypothetical protein
LARLPLIVIFAWMCTIGTLMHTHVFVHGTSGAAAVQTLGAAVDTDDCGACDWNLAVQTAVGVHYCLHLSTASLSLTLARIAPICLSRRPLDVSLRAPPCS